MKLRRAAANRRLILQIKSQRSSLNGQELERLASNRSPRAGAGSTSVGRRGHGRSLALPVLFRESQLSPPVSRQRAMA